MPVAKATVPEPTLGATLRVQMSRATLITAAATARSEASCHCEGRPRATSTPRKPTSTATQRRGPTRSLNSKAAAVVSRIGLAK
jgi:hypothetical protein